MSDVEYESKKIDEFTSVLVPVEKKPAPEPKAPEPKPKKKA